MNRNPSSCTSYFRPFFLLLLLLALPFHVSAQATKAVVEPPPPPKKAPAPAAKPTPPPPPASKKDQPADDHGEAKSTSGAHSSGNTNTPAMNRNNSTGPSNHANTGTNGTHRTAPGLNHKGGTTAGKDRTPPAPVEKDPRAPTGLNLRTADSAGTGKAATGPNAMHANPSTTANANNIPGAIKLPNGGTKLSHPDGSAVEWNRSGKVSAVTTPMGATAKMDASGKPVAIHDGKGTSISRGPHGERRVETTRADHTRLVSTGRHGGYLEHPITRGGHEYALRTYYSNGRLYARVYAPYFYLGYPYYGYIPPFYYVPAFYSWAYNAWPQPVAFAWGWYGAPWHAAYGYYFAPYPVYPAPAFWLADYAMAQSLQAGAEDTDSTSLGADPGFVYVSAQAAPQAQVNGSPLVSSVLKDQIAEQVKQIIGDEKDAASRQGSSAATPAVPPSLDPRFALFIVSSALSLDTDYAPCSLTSGDIVHRKEYAPDAQGELAVDVVSSKNGDCPVGTASRLKVDALEEMHDNLRQKVDDGLKSLSESQGKAGIPTGPAAGPTQVLAGEADPDPAVADALKKQQEAADQTEKEIQAAASSDSGSAD